jgi:hypothetical protein
MGHRLAVVLFGLVVLVGACNRTPESPTAPDPATPPAAPPVATPRALLSPVGVHQFSGCINASVDTTCVFSASLVNRGTGCANHVAGTTRLFDVSGLQLGGVYRWQLPTQQIVSPDERVQYFANFVPFSQAIRVTSYLTDVDWVDTNCR